ncbi:universal stress protein [Companilactobacillus sp.]|jgi:nucleotide-binding universal stress UspA family protein|uniref:universal stress protein n=1 Tax=Companilactobacillus sp. TaxID=2767905 RepID=UPI0025C3C1A2|nr:universal stress protein [Companilactobacillus sp.]MCH4009048.1 universal stress protein [Companilactobacillus sp.]MCH4050773.1 universal stress protein [Companilactobacillus sp.]MCH4076990.1 universal stress protein [Companilactobacillus sp.]MCH4125566.1 universal stress protein [Companilactobacillus sp.]MCI1311275.1 universal stress protein [Companilactobacillus sp.]
MTSYNKVLVAVDDSQDSKLAFNYAIQRCKRDKSELDIVSILEDKDLNSYQILSKKFLNGQRSKLLRELQQDQQTAEKQGVKTVHTYTTEGDDEAGQIIVRDIIPDVKPDLLVIGSKSQHGVEQYFGSQASYMVKHAPISVMVVK